MAVATDTLWLRRRGGVWYYHRRIPRAYARVIGREHVTITTGIQISNDPRAIRAVRRVEQLNELVERYWRNKAAGGNSEASEMAHRLGAFNSGGGWGAPTADDTWHLSTLVEAYQRNSATLHLKKSQAQKKRWRQTRELALAWFIKAVGGDGAVTTLTRKHVLVARNHYMSCVHIGRLDINTANKYLGYVATMFRSLNDIEQLGLDDVFSRTRIPGGEKKRRPAFKAAFVQERLFADGALAGLNDEARAAVYLMAETGLRPSEMCALNEASIFLNGPLPFVRVQEINGIERRELKTRNAARDMPLVGAALKAMIAHPKGLPRYREKADCLSATVNKFLQENNLLPSAKHSMYSLRHLFKDRLKAVRAPEEMILELMGHSLAGEEYGEGYSLEAKHEYLKAMAFQPPSESSK